MSESTNGHRESRGAQAYRWMVMAALGIISVLSLRQLNNIDESTKKVEALQGQVWELRGAVENIKTTVDGVKGNFETRLSDHQRQINALEGFNHKQDRQLEELQRQQWQRR